MKGTWLLKGHLHTQRMTGSRLDHNEASNAAVSILSIGNHTDGGIVGVRAMTGRLGPQHHEDLFKHERVSLGIHGVLVFYPS